MSSPKHLWSGDWERDSQQPPVAPAAPMEPAPPEAPEEEPSAPRRSARTRLTVLGALLAVLIIVGVVLALTLPGSSKHLNRPATAHNHSNPFNQTGGAGLTPSQPSTHTPQSQPQAQPSPSAAQAPSQVQVGPTYRWLGMQVSNTPTGVVVATVQIGSAADSAGVNPGDVISQVNSTEVGSIAQLTAAVDQLKLGAGFELTVDRGTTPVTISATLANRPKRQS